MANEGTQPSLFVENKPAVLRMADFGDLAQFDTKESHVKELIWQLEMYHSQNSGAVTVSRDVLRARFYWNAGISRRVFDAARKAAEELKVIRVDRDPRKMGGQGANTYLIDWKRIQKLGSIQAESQATSATPEIQPPFQATSATHPAEQPSDRVPENEYPGIRNEVAAVSFRGGAVSFRRPLNKEYNHPSVTVSKTHGHGFSRDQGNGSPWPRSITEEDLRQKRSVLRLYRIAVAKGYVLDSEVNMIRFFSQARYCRTAADVQSPGAVFTSRIKEGMTKSVRQEDEDAARLAVRELLYGANANE